VSSKAVRFAKILIYDDFQFVKKAGHLRLAI
jgi:hypothetical protein